MTKDIDLPPDTEEANLRRLADELNEPEYRLVTDPAVPSSWVALPADYFAPKRAADRARDRAYFAASEDRD